jgi:hypothetical protein
MDSLEWNHRNLDLISSAYERVIGVIRGGLIGYIPGSSGGWMDRWTLSWNLSGCELSFEASALF